MLSTAFVNLSSCIIAGDRLIVAVSGGPDSTALLDILNGFSKQTPCEIIVAHVNHGIRGKDASRDEAFVKKLAAFYGLKRIIKRVKLKGSHLEERGREVRREFFEKLRKKYGAKWIITAHTRDDQLETIIFNFIRGAGVAGLAGMQMADGAYLKPLLDTSKFEILAYLKSKKLKFRIDKTNADTHFSRNFIRRKILPLFSKLNPSLKNTLLRNSGIFRDLEKWLLDEAQKFLHKQKSDSKTGFVFNAKDFLFLPRPVRQEVIRTIFKAKIGLKHGPSFIKMREILELINKNVGKKKIYVNKKAVFSIDKGKVWFNAKVSITK